VWPGRSPRLLPNIGQRNLKGGNCPNGQQRRG
jgi:hypothetical protein